MKKSFVFVLFQFIFWMGLQAQDQPSGGLVFSTTSINYGTIKKGAEPLRRVEFVNNGKDKIFITEAKGSCGCTVAEFPKDVILPGEKSYIDVRYDTKRTGKFSKVVTVVASDGSKHLLTVVGEVLEG